MLFLFDVVSMLLGNTEMSQFSCGHVFMVLMGSQLTVKIGLDL